MNDMTFKINSNGEIIEYKILKILVPKNGKYKYIVYTDDKNNTYSSRFEIKDDQIVLKPIENKYEWDYIDENMEKDGKNA